MTYGHAFMVAAIYCGAMLDEVACSLHVLDDVQRSVTVPVRDIHVAAC